MSNTASLMINKNQKQLSIEGTFPISYIKDDGYFTVFCPILDDISSYGETLEEAEANFNTALVGSLLIMSEDGTLKDFLSNCGWKIDDTQDIMKLYPPISLTINNFKPDFSGLTHA